VPRELIEAAENRRHEPLQTTLRSVIPCRSQRPASQRQALLCVIFRRGNEYFYAIQLNFANGVDDASMGDPANVSYATAATFPREAFPRPRSSDVPPRRHPAGWAAQKRMIPRGSSMGAIK